mmetsp:Transcript_33476/g.78249  ORF Transcript_33476/g.78249 Transcript_33476/m.78249 type:complete len:211 (-) Transcript_33476:339-971(-)
MWNDKCFRVHGLRKFASTVVVFEALLAAKFLLSSLTSEWEVPTATTRSQDVAIGMLSSPAPQKQCHTMSVGCSSHMSTTNAAKAGVACVWVCSREPTPSSKTKLFFSSPTSTTISCLACRRPYSNSSAWPPTMAFLERATFATTPTTRFGSAATMAFASGRKLPSISVTSLASMMLTKHSVLRAAVEAPSGGLVQMAIAPLKTPVPHFSA